MLERAASFHKKLISESSGFDTAYLEEENRRLSIELAIAHEQEKAVQERAAHLARANAALQKTIDALGNINRIEDFIPLVLKIVLENFQAVSCAFFECVGEDLIYLRYWLIEGQVLSPVEILALDPDKYALIIRLAGGFTAPDEYLGTHHRYRIHAASLDHAAGTCVSEFDHFCCSCGWESELNVPCVIGDVAEGALVIYRGAGLPYSDQEIALAETLSAQLALALQASRLAEEAKQAAVAREQEKAAQERTVELLKANAVLTNTLDRLAKEPDPNAFLGYLLLEIVRQVAACKVHVFLYSAATNTLEQTICVQDGEIHQPYSPRDPSLFHSPFAADITPAWQVLIEQQKIIVTAGNQLTEMHWQETIAWHQIQGHSLRATLALMAGTQPVGLLAIAFRDRESLQQAELDLIRALANQATLAIQLTQLAEEAKQAAIAREQQQTALERAAELATINRQLQQHTQEVQRSYSILEATAQATNALLTIPDFDQAVNATLQILGEALETDRVKILEWVFDPFLHPASGYYTISYEWVRAGTIPQLAHPSSSQISIHGAEAFIENLIQNDGFGGLLHEWPQVFWEPFAAVQAQGIYCVPIRVERQLWGVLVYDDCQTSRERNCSELTVLKIAADCIGSAIQRQRTQQALLQSEQARSGELAKANHALRRAIARLTTADSLQLFLNAVLKEAFQTSSGVNGAAVFDYEPASHTVQLLGLVISGEVIDIASDPRAEVYRSPIPSEAAGDWHIPDPERRIVWIDIDDPVLLHTPEAVLWHKQQGHQLLNVIPLFSGEQPLGFLGLAFTTRTPPSDAQIEHWWALAQHVGLALRLANLAEEAKQTAILDERNRMARDIHDTLAQSFTGIIMQLEALKSSPRLTSDETQAHLNRIRDIARLGLSEARRSVQALRPSALETASFPDALRHLLNQMTQGTPVQTTLHIEGVAQSLPASVEENLLRIAQEAVTNAIRHGQAQAIALQLLFEPTAVHLQIRDDGQGFVPATHLTSGFGLIGMQERVHHLGGHLHLVSQPGQGTEITVTIPS